MAIRLLMYCHAVEMSSVHNPLAKILGIVQGRSYHVNPLGYANRRKSNKNIWFKRLPKSATAKWNLLRRPRSRSANSNLPA